MSNRSLRSLRALDGVKDKLALASDPPADTPPEEVDAERQVVWSSEALPETVESGLVPFPKLPDLQSLTADQSVGERIREGAKLIITWVTTTMDGLAVVFQADRETREYKASDIAKAKEGLKNVLRDPTMAYCRAAWMAAITHSFAGEIYSRADAIAILDKLVSEDPVFGRALLNRHELKEGEKPPEGSFPLWGNAYTVPPESAFEEPEMAELRKFFFRLLGRVWETEKRIRAEVAVDLFAESTISLNQFLAGMPGKLALGIPPEQVFERDGVTPVMAPGGKPKWRAGGVLLVELDSDGKIWPLKAIGGIANAIEAARGMGVYLFQRALAWNKPPSVDTVSTDMNSKLQVLWFLLQRGIRAEKEKLELQTAKVEFEAKTTVTPHQFFLEGKPGICLVDFHGVWEQRSPEGVISRVPNLFLLVERFFQEGEEEGTTNRFIRIVEVPTHIGDDYFGQCQGDYTEGNRFQGIPYPLIAVLQAVFGQVLKSQPNGNSVNGSK